MNSLPTTMFRPCLLVSALLLSTISLIADPAVENSNSENSCYEPEDNCAEPDPCIATYLPVCPPAEICNNGVDDDGDGLIDCLDPDCYGSGNCPDSDSDGLVDVLDIDDDNDGVLDVDEKDCFISNTMYPGQMSWHGSAAGNISSPSTSALSMSGSAWANAYSDQTFFIPISIEGTIDVASNGMLGVIPTNYPETSSWNDNGFKFQFNGTNGMYVRHGSDISGWHGPSIIGKTFKLEIDAVGQMKYWHNGAVVYTGTVPDVAYRITTARGSFSMSNLSITAVSSTTAPNLCSGKDSDSDGTPDHLDLDSDGDGCSDAYEAGATTDATESFSFTTTAGTASDSNSDGLADAVDSDGNSVPDHESSYATRALNALVNACTDSDNDGIGDLDDIDDDNDGILDIHESNCLTLNTTLPGNLSWHGAAAGNVSSPTASALDMSGSAWRNAYSDQTFFLPITIEGTLTSASNGMLGIIPTTYSETNDWNDNGYKFQFNGSNGMYVRHGSDNSGWHSPSMVGKSFKLEIDAAGQTKYWHNGVVVHTGTVPDVEYRLTISRGSFSMFDLSIVAVSRVADPNYCLGLDSDLDGTPNHLDLDSDGDGCSDAYEAGATNSTTANFSFNSTAGTASDSNSDGLADAIDANSNGAPDYFSNYDPRALSAALDACRDSDGDGVGDLDDIDDDNDGVLDVIESPSCFMDSTDHPLSGDRSTAPGFSVSTDLNTSTNNAISESVDGVNTNSSNLRFNNAQTLASRTMYQVELPVALKLAALKFEYSSNNGFFVDGKLKLQGSNDDSNWTDLNDGTVNHVTDPTPDEDIFAVDQNEGRYKYYRLLGVSGTTYSNGYGELKLILGSDYNAHYYPTANCSADTDQDGTLNHLDTDSDGDGCFDAYEAGAANSNIATVAGAFGANGLSASVEDNDTFNTSVTYTYLGYDADEDISFCTDTDSDGVPDVQDIDDDNDGVLDVTEKNCLVSMTMLPGNMSWHGAAAGNISSPLETSLNMSGSAWRNAYSDQTFFLPITIEGTVNSASNGMLGIIPISYAETNDWNDYGFKFQFNGANGMYVRHGSDISGWHSPSIIATTFKLEIDAAGQMQYWHNGVVVQTGTVPDVEFRITTARGSFSIVDLTITAVSMSADPNQCSGVDTDGDGTPNHLDLDSDGDGCSDAFEAGATSSTSSNFSYSSTAGTASDANSDGLPDVVDSNNNSVPDYFSNYDPRAISATLDACLDSDGDGVGDLDDIDDDNDGVLDVIESPSCFMDSTEHPLSGDRSLTTGFSVSTDLNTLTNHPVVESIDGVKTNSSNLRFTDGQALANEVMYHIELPVALKLLALKFEYSSTNGFFNNGQVKLQGSNDDSNWTDLNDGTVNYALDPTPDEDIFTVDQNADRYMFYRLFGVSGTTYSNGRGELQLIIGSDYNAHYYPTDNCSADTDQDGTLNHLDTDSDGDGCFDAYEAGAANSNIATVAGAFGTNGLSALVENDDTFNTSITYTYLGYDADKDISFCTDTDSDGVPDVIDIDDDNDGVLDVIEKNCLVSNTMLPGNMTWHGAAAGNISSPSPAALNMSGSAWRNAYSDQTFFIPITIEGTINTASNGMLGIIPTSYSETNDWNDQGFKFQFNGANGMYVRHGSSISGWHAPSIIGTTFKLEIDAAGQMQYWHNGVVVHTGTVPNVEYRITTSRGSFSMSNLSINAVSMVLDPNQCSGVDTDGDGTPNHLDLDSDGDGCSDAFEAGATSSTSSNFSYSSTAGNASDANSDGLPDVVDSNNNSVPDYFSNYDPRAISAALDACLDSDGDGVGDLDDIDDDNDGVLDVIESPSCFMDSTEHPLRGDRSAVSGFLVSTDLNTNSNNPIIESIDGVKTNTSNLRFSNGQTLASEVMYQIELPVALKLLALKFEYSSNAGFFNNGQVKLQASNDANTWTDLNDGTVVYTTDPTPDEDIFMVDQNADRYKYYRLFGVSGTTYSNGRGELRLIVGADYNAHYHPSGNCSADTDQDGTLNHLDTDSDGDGCFDAFEAGAANSNIATIAGAFGANGLSASVESNDTFDATVTYNYLGFEADDALVRCLDSDGDGIADVLDLDDDNDGILDVIEKNCLVSNTMLPGNMTWHGAAAGNISSPSPTALNMSGSAWVNAYSDQTFFIPITIEGTVETASNGMLGIIPTSYTETNGWNDQGFKFQFNGSNGMYVRHGSNISGWHAPSIIGTTFKLEIDAAGQMQYWHNGVVVHTGTVPDVEYRTTTSRGSFSISNLSITAISLVIDPNYCEGVDTDGDGDLDHLDLDSDNDGCFDALEGSQTFSVNELNSDGTLSGNVDTNGVPVSAGASGQGIGDSQDANVQSANCSIDAVEDKVDVIKNTATPIDVLVNDIFFHEIGEMSINIISGSSSGALVTVDASGASPILVYTPANEYLGNDTVVYQIESPSGQTSTDTLFLSIYSPLPIDLVSFDAYTDLDNQVVDLVWITATEVNNELFIVLRSADTETWEPLLEMPGAGHSNSTIVYRNRDMTPLNGVSYYRLRQVDYDGTYMDSDIRAVQFDRKEEFIIYPNPASGQFNILDPEMSLDPHADVGSIHMYDASGREVDIRINAGQGRFEVFLQAGLAPGHYVLLVKDDAHIIQIY